MVEKRQSLSAAGLRDEKVPAAAGKRCHLSFQVTTWDWTRAEKSFTVYEIMFKILKVQQGLSFSFL